MAQYEQPVNQLNFKDGQEPDNQRIEEQFMYKYMQMRPEKQVVAKKGIEEAQTGVEDSDGDNEDPELEKFANEEMDREMRRMASGAPGGMPDSDEEDLSLDEEPMGSSELDEDEDGEGSDGDGGFFSGEDDLQEVKMSQDEEDDEDGSEGEDLMSEDSYGAQLSDGDEDEEDDEGSDLPEEELTGKQKAKNAALKKKRGRNSEFEGHNMK